MAEPTPQDQKHVQGKKLKTPRQDRQHQAENPDHGQQGDGRRRNNPDVERNFEDQAR